MAVEISTLDELQAINEDLSADYVLTDDIDAEATKEWNQLNWCGTWDSDTTYNENDYIEESGNYYYMLQYSYTSGSDFDSSEWVETTEFTDGSKDDGEALGFRPLGWREFGSINAFTGTFDGQGHTIRGLYINRGQENNAGLFGYANGSTIENVGLEDVNISKGSGPDWWRGTGGLVGHSLGSATVSDSYSTGTVSGNSRVGGLVGRNRHSSTVSNSYATGTVNGSDEVGGLVGYSRLSSTISNSYSTGTVSGNNRVGGLAGYNWDSEVSNSYSTGTVSGDDYVGGLVGRIYNIEGQTDEILYSYANSDINPDLDLIGAKDNNGELDTTGSSLKTTAEMTDYPDYPDAYVGWTFTES